MTHTNIVKAGERTFLVTIQFCGEYSHYLFNSLRDAHRFARNEELDFTIREVSPVLAFGPYENEYEYQQEKKTEEANDLFNEEAIRTP